jgi:DNA-binding response OmpR family regulator
VPPAAQPSQRHHPLRILLIEDSPADALMMSARLQEVTEFIFDMRHATTLSSGLELAAEGNVDAIILDLTLPDSAGLGAYSKLRAKVSESVPIIIVTGPEERDLVSEALREGADNYLVKNKADGNRIAIAILSAIRNRSIKSDSGAQTTIDD